MKQSVDYGFGNKCYIIRDNLFLEQNTRFNKTFSLFIFLKSTYLAYICTLIKAATYQKYFSTVFIRNGLNVNFLRTFDKATCLRAFTLIANDCSPFSKVFIP